MNDPINHLMEVSRRARHKQEFAAMDSSELPQRNDKELAAWQSQFSSDQPQWRLAEHEWQRRITDRQIAAAHAAARRAALWGAIAGIAGAIIGGVTGAFLAWILSGAQPPTIKQGNQLQTGNSTNSGAQAQQQQPVSALPQQQTPASPAPVQRATTPTP